MQAARAEVRSGSISTTGHRRSALPDVPVEDNLLRTGGPVGERVRGTLERT